MSTAEPNDTAEESDHVTTEESDHVTTEEKEALHFITKIHKLLFVSIAFGFSLAIAFGTWMARFEYLNSKTVDKLEAHAAELTHHAVSIMEFGMWKASTEPNRFTAQDHVRYAEAVSTIINNNSLRIQRLEDMNSSIRERLQSIDTKLDRLDIRLDDARDKKRADTEKHSSSNTALIFGTEWNNPERQPNQ